MTTPSTKANSPARDLFDSAVAHHLAGRADAAIDVYRDAIASDPALAPAMNNLGALLGARGLASEALELFRRAVNVDPAYAEAHNNLGIALTHSGRHAEAIAHFEAALEHEPKRAVWWNNLGNACVECFRFDRALDAYDRAIAIEPASADVWSNRGLALRGLRHPDEAIASFRRSLEVDPRFANALVNLGIVLKEQKRTDEAIAAFERARSLRPNDPALLCNYASVYESRGDYERMRELAELAATLDPAFPESHVLRGNYYMERGDFSAAEAAYQHARSLDAGNRNANWNLAIIWLLQGDYARGWAQFEWRKRLQSVLLEHNEYPGEAWTGDPLRDRSILLYSEQGLGDAIQFVRYAEEVARRGAGRVIVEAPATVTALLATARGVDEVVARGTPLPSVDLHASLMDLPRLLGTDLGTIPDAVPYLDAPPRPVSSLIDAPPGVLKIGIVWAGNPMHQRDHLRSLPLAQLAPILDVPGARFFSLQKGGPEGELVRIASDRVVDLSPHLADFRDTAAAISRLDLVLTVDTSVAHLAAALGRETWVMVTHVPDFRWMLERDDSPWYPSVRLFRQPAPRDWASVIARVRRALSERMRSSLPVTKTSEPDEALTVLQSAARRPDGRARFELGISLADLALEESFAAYESELLGRGTEPALTRFLDEALREGDMLLDPVPGLGVAALNVATAPKRVTVHVVEPDARRAARLTRAARDAGADARLVIHRELPKGSALGVTEPGPAAVGRRTVLRIGDPGATPEVLGGLASDGLDLSAVVWPSARAAQIRGALDVLAHHGFWLGTLSLVGGEVTIDPLGESAAAHMVIAIDPVFLAELAGENVPAQAEIPSANPSVEAPGPSQWIAFDWEVRADTGWGVYGLNLATQLALLGNPAPIVLACDEDTLPPLVRHRLRDTLAASAPARDALCDATAIVDIDGTVLRAFGNGFVGAPHAPRLRARKNVGVVFFEDTHFAPDAIDQAAALDAIIAGSSWNAEVLRAYGLRNVHTVIQGVDPTVFHPAERTGLFRDRFVVFSGGKLEYRKGQDIVVAAFRRFHERHPDALLVTAWHNHWPRLISDLELAGHVRGAPRVANGSLQVVEWLAANGIPETAVLDVGRTPNVLMGQIVREADVALFPNRCEGGTNLVAMECMAAGIPTIVSANTGHLDLLATGGCFALRRQRNVKQPSRYFTGVDGWGESHVDEIVELLERLYTDRALATDRASIGAAAMANLTWHRQVRALLAALGHPCHPEASAEGDPSADASG
jgi:tetratricopeptide (TPR) repeat protein/glycosyltransferase involved in cell wall biosynthesis